MTRHLESLVLKYNNYTVSQKASLIGIFSIIYICIFSTPAITNLLSPNAYLQLIGEQMNAPLKPLGFTDERTHGSKLAYRLTVPVIGYLIPFVSLKVKIILLYIMRIFMMFYLTRKLFITLKGMCDYKFLSEIFTFSIFFLWFGKSFIDDFMWFDEIAFFFLFTSLISRNTLVVFISVILACYTDERSYFSLLLIMIYRCFFEDGAIKEIKYTFNNLFAILVKNWAIPTAMLICVLIRLYLQKVHHFKIGELIFLDYLQRGNLDYYSIGLWAGYKNLWVIIITALAIMYRKKKILIAALLCSALLANLLVASSVFDLTRSISYSFPILLISMFYISNVIISANDFKKVKVYYFIVAVFISSLLVPPIMVADKPDIHHNIILKALEHR